MNDRDLAHAAAKSLHRGRRTDRTADATLARGSQDARQRRHRNGTGYIELRSRLDTSQTELVLVPIDGTEPLWLTQMGD